MNKDIDNRYKQLVEKYGIQLRHFTLADDHNMSVEEVCYALLDAIEAVAEGKVKVVKWVDPLVETLEFYADGQHLMFGDENEWENIPIGCTMRPQKLVWSGTVARCLIGKYKEFIKNEN